MSTTTLSTVKKIKGQINGRHYAFLVSLAQREKCRISEILRDMVVWALNSNLLLSESRLTAEDLSSTGAHTYLNFNADAVLLQRWERFKRVNRLTGDSMAIRFVVTTAYLLSFEKEPTQQQTFEF